MRKKEAVLAFSGGFDSSLVLSMISGSSRFPDKITCIDSESGSIKTIDGGFNSDYQSVRLVNITCDQFSYGQKARQDASMISVMNKLNETLKKNKKSFNFGSGISKINVQLENNGYKTKIIIQQVMVVHHMVMIADDYSDVFIGWHYGDDAFRFIDSIRNVFVSTCECLGKKLRLILPLSFTPKDHILIQNYNIGLWDKANTCESQDTFFRNGTHCGHCTPCKNLIKSILFIDDRKIPEAYLSMFEKESISRVVSKIKDKTDAILKDVVDSDSDKSPEVVYREHVSNNREDSNHTFDDVFGEHDEDVLDREDSNETFDDHFDKHGKVLKWGADREKKEVVKKNRFNLTKRVARNHRNRN
jgi:hypothetical protein